MQTIVAYVENKPGVLNRVASLTRRLAINIDSLTVGNDARRTERDTLTEGSPTIPIESVVFTKQGDTFQSPSRAR